MPELTIKTTVQNMLGLKFGKYGASNEALKEKYLIFRGLTGETYCERFYYDTYHSEDAEPVAISKEYIGEKKHKCDIEDRTTGRTYSTGWRDRNDTNTKFTSIEVNGYKITDNGNGIVDETDIIQGGNLQEPMTLLQFLNNSI